MGRSHLDDNSLLLICFCLDFFAAVNFFFLMVLVFFPLIWGDLFIAFQLKGKFSYLPLSLHFFIKFLLDHFT